MKRKTPSSIKQEPEDKWFAVAAVLMMRLKTDHVRITAKDFKKLGSGKQIVAEAEEDGLHVRLVKR